MTCPEKRVNIPHMDQATKRRVSAEIRAHAGRRNLSQRDLAAQLDMSQPALSRRLNCEQPWDLDELDAVAAVFGIDVRDLIPEPPMDRALAT